MDLSHIQKFNFFKDKDFTNNVDYLTNILNRQAIFDYVSYLIENNIPFTICVSDVDNFKNINDTYGHLVGDKVLKGVAYLFEQCIGDKGVVGRFGGDEFIFVLENITEYDDVWNVCHNINIELSKFCISATGRIFISTTTGIARYPKDASNIEELFHIADKALYRGKKKGRNCFIIYLPEKHKNIEINNNREASTNLDVMVSKCFKMLTASSDVEKQIDLLLKGISSQFMYDHICIETPTTLRFENCHKLSYTNEFKHIDFNLLNSTIGNIGLYTIKDLEIIKNINKKLYGEFHKQKVCSTMLVKIAAYDKEYGIIRVDATNTCRVWQQEDIILFLNIANAVALILYYNDKTL